MNLVRYRRNLLIIAGMILLNIGTLFFINERGCDVVVITSYFSLNSIWISMIVLATNKLVRAVDKYLEDEMY